jgi:hypothetical protein
MAIAELPATADWVSTIWGPDDLVIPMLPPAWLRPDHDGR